MSAFFNSLTFKNAFSRATANFCTQQAWQARAASFIGSFIPGPKGDLIKSFSKPLVGFWDRAAKSFAPESRLEPIPVRAVRFPTLTPR